MPVELARLEAAALAAVARQPRRVSMDQIAHQLEVVGDVQAYVDAGCQEFVLWFRDYPSTESLERFITEVAPKIT